MTSPKSTTTHSPVSSPSLPNGITERAFALTIALFAIEATCRLEVPLQITIYSVMLVNLCTSITTISLAFDSSSTSVTRVFNCLGCMLGIQIKVDYTHFPPYFGRILWH